MKLEELKQAKATYDLYGPTMLGVDTINYLFETVIDLQSQFEAKGVVEREVDAALEKVVEAKPKRAAKKAE